MKQTPFEIITEEEIRAILLPLGFGWGEIKNQKMADGINSFLNERGKRGYTRIPTRDVCSFVTNKKFEVDTHEALVFLRPIETKEPEVYCDLGQRLCAIQGIDEDLRDILLEVIQGSALNTERD